MTYKTAIVSAQAAAILVFCGLRVMANSNGVLSTYFPTNLVLGMAKSEIEINRPAAVDSIINFSGANFPSPKMLELTTLAGSRGGYMYHFVEDKLRAITSSTTTNVNTNDLASQIETDAFSHVSSETFLRWNGRSTDLVDISVDIWQWTNQDVRLCSGVFSNETTLILYDKTVFSPSNFFTPTSQRDAMHGIVNKYGIKPEVILEAQVTLKPEALEVSPGILTAFVRLPAGYAVSNITSATCDGAPCERMTPNEDGTEMIVKFRRQDIEKALAQVGESLDTNFVVRGIWRGAAGTNLFQGADSITKIVGAKEKKK